METFGSVELTLREYLRHDPQLLQFINNDIRRIDIDDAGVNKTFVTIFRAGGFIADKINYQEAGIQLHCFGSSWNNAQKLANIVVHALRICHGYQYAGVRISSISSINMYDNPLVDGQSRFVVSTIVRNKAVAIV